MTRTAEKLVFRNEAKSALIGRTYRWSVSEIIIFFLKKQEDEIKCWSALFSVMENKAKWELLIWDM